ncbi:MAG: hypothetical protein GY696_27630 [Gammaproteobacteria bacterium]|nr:hypothetical protein [Gammaproteobacteria bacterium]
MVASTRCGGVTYGPPAARWRNAPVGPKVPEVRALALTLWIGCLPSGQGGACTPCATPGSERLCLGIGRPNSSEFGGYPGVQTTFGYLAHPISVLTETDLYSTTTPHNISSPHMATWGR